MLFLASSQNLNKTENLSYGKELPYVFPKGRILDSFKLKEFAEDNFKFDLNGRKLSKWVENAVGKGEIAFLRAVSPFPQSFQKNCIAGT